jgi:hypothetical protein
MLSEGVRHACLFGRLWAMLTGIVGNETHNSFTEYDFIVRLTLIERVVRRVNTNCNVVSSETEQD